MTKVFPASESKLAQLRQKGIFPRSNYTQRMIRAVVFVVVIFTVLPVAFSIEDFKSFFEQNGSQSFQNIFSLFTRLNLVLLFSLSISFFLGLFQTRFFFSPAVAKVDFSRFKFIDSATFKSMFYHLAGVSILVCAMSVTFYNNLAQYFVPPKTSIDQAFFKAEEILWDVSLVYLAYLIAFGLSSYLINWLMFKKQQMMTREELEAEHREQQAPRFQR
jgi:flagellar biosynthesis protein FlhB